MLVSIPSFIAIFLSPLGPLTPPERRNLEKIRTIVLKNLPPAQSNYKTSESASGYTLNSPFTKNSIKKIYDLLDKELVEYTAILNKIEVWKKEMEELLALFATLSEDIVQSTSLLPIFLYPHYIASLIEYIRTTLLPFFHTVHPITINMRNRFLLCAIAVSDAYHNNQTIPKNDVKKNIYSYTLTHLNLLNSYLETFSNQIDIAIHAPPIALLILELWNVPSFGTHCEIDGLAKKIIEDYLESDLSTPKLKEIFWNHLNWHQNGKDFFYTKITRATFDQELENFTLSSNDSEKEKSYDPLARIIELNQIIKHFCTKNISSDLLWINKTTLKNTLKRISGSDKKTNLLLLVSESLFYQESSQPDVLYCSLGIKKNLISQLYTPLQNAQTSAFFKTGPIGSLYLDVLNKSINPPVREANQITPPHFKKLADTVELLKDFPAEAKNKMHQETFILASHPRNCSPGIADFNLYPEVLTGEFNRFFKQLKTHSDSFFPEIWEIFNQEVLTSFISKAKNFLSNWNKNSVQFMAELLLNEFQSFAKKMEVTPVNKLDTLIVNSQRLTAYHNIISSLHQSKTFDNAQSLTHLNPTEIFLYQERKEDLYIDVFKKTFLEYTTFNNFQWLDQTGKIFDTEFKNHQKEFPDHTFFLIPQIHIIPLLRDIHHLFPIQSAIFYLQNLPQTEPEVSYTSLNTEKLSHSSPSSLNHIPSSGSNPSPQIDLETAPPKKNQPKELSKSPKKITKKLTSESLPMQPSLALPKEKKRKPKLTLPTSTQLKQEEKTLDLVLEEDDSVWQLISKKITPKKEFISPSPIKPAAKSNLRPLAPPTTKSTITSSHTPSTSLAVKHEIKSFILPHQKPISVIPTPIPLDDPSQKPMEILKAAETPLSPTTAKCTLDTIKPTEKTLLNQITPIPLAIPRLEKTLTTLSPFNRIILTPDLSSNLSWNQTNAEEIGRFFATSKDKSLFMDKSIHSTKNWIDLLLVPGKSGKPTSQTYLPPIAQKDPKNRLFEVVPTLAFCYLLCFQEDYYRALAPLVIHLQPEDEYNIDTQIAKKNLLSILEKNQRPSWDEVSKWIFEEMMSRCLSFRYYPPETIRQYFYLFSIFVDKNKISKNNFETKNQYYLYLQNPSTHTSRPITTPLEFELFLDLFHGLKNNIFYQYLPSEALSQSQPRYAEILNNFPLFKENLPNLTQTPNSFLNCNPLFSFQNNPTHASSHQSQ